MARPDPQYFHCFDTALGCCAIAWTDAHGVQGSQLPEENAAATRDRIRVRFPLAQQVEQAQQLPAEIAQAVAAIQALLAGKTSDAGELLGVRLDERDLPEFDARVLTLTRHIPVGQTLSYGQVAARLGQPGAARAVGRAEGRNPFAPIVPCHRVVAATPGQGGFSAHGGLQTKQKLLIIEARASGQVVCEQQGLFE
nr:methylated-DNA--[protein]-cysteine S-methyltransferase [uncultured Roseateles sp.]